MRGLRPARQAGSASSLHTQGGYSGDMSRPRAGASPAAARVHPWGAWRARRARASSHQQRSSRVPCPKGFQPPHLRIVLGALRRLSAQQLLPPGRRRARQAQQKRQRREAGSRLVLVWCQPGPAGVAGAAEGSLRGRRAVCCCVLWCRQAGAARAGAMLPRFVPRSSRTCCASASGLPTQRPLTCTQTAPVPFCCRSRSGWAGPPADGGRPCRLSWCSHSRHGPVACQARQQRTGCTVQPAKHARAAHRACR